jgi:hypothetical protein
MDDLQLDREEAGLRKNANRSAFSRRADLKEGMRISQARYGCYGVFTP